MGLLVVSSRANLQYGDSILKVADHAMTVQNFSQRDGILVMVGEHALMVK